MYVPTVWIIFASIINVGLIGWLIKESIQKSHWKQRSSDLQVENTSLKSKEDQRKIIKEQLGEFKEYVTLNQTQQNKSTERIERFLFDGRNRLSPALYDVFELAITEGLSSKDMGEKLNKSPRTIEGYITKICDEFGVKGKKELIALAMKQFGVTKEELV